MTVSVRISEMKNSKV